MLRTDAICVHSHAQTPDVCVGGYHGLVLDFSMFHRYTGMADLSDTSRLWFNFVCLCVSLCVRRHVCRHIARRLMNG